MPLHLTVRGYFVFMETILNTKTNENSLLKKAFAPEKFLAVAAAMSALSVALITVFVFRSGLPAIADYGFTNFLFGSTWRPTSGEYGILALTVGTLSVTGTALLIGIPTGIACAVFIAEILPKRLAHTFKFAVELLAGIPSVVYGFVGLILIIPLIRDTLLPLWQKVDPSAQSVGLSVLAGGIVLAVMILPTIVSMSVNAIEAVPREYKEASLAIGANRRETQMKVLIPAARSGILASVILGMGRAIGETMAVVLITGNTALIPDSIFSPAATLTGTIALEMGYATPEHQQALFAVGIVLFVIIFILNMIAQTAAKRMAGGTK
jgi:phosphate transport system permease protein